MQRHNEIARGGDSGTYSTELLVRGEYSSNETNCCGSSIVAVGNANIPVRTSLTDPAQTVNLFELTHTRIGYDHGTPSMNDLQQHELVNKAVSAELNTLLGEQTLTYQAYYRDWEATGNIDPWANAIKIYPQYFAGTNQVQSMQHELRLTSPGRRFRAVDRARIRYNTNLGEHDLLFGLNYRDTKVERGNYLCQKWPTPVGRVRGQQRRMRRASGSSFKRCA